MAMSPPAVAQNSHEVSPLHEREVAAHAGSRAKRLTAPKHHHGASQVQVRIEHRGRRAEERISCALAKCMLE
eukprot:2211706-Prymnesium_polylepis.1